MFRSPPGTPRMTTRVPSPPHCFSLRSEPNPSIHCRGPLIEHLYVTRNEELVPALERAAANRDRGGRPMDRHIASFAVARSPDVDERFVRPLSGADQSGTDQILAALTLLARVQAMAKNGPAPALRSEEPTSELQS